MKCELPTWFRTTAFTLVEMMVIIALIALLIAMLLPALDKARSASRSAMCLTKLNQFYKADVAFASENHGYSVRTLEPKADTPKKGVWWTSTLFNFSSGGDLKFCPEADSNSGNTPTMNTLSIGNRHRAWFDGVQYPPSASKPEVGSYGQNMWVSRWEGSITNWGYPKDKHYSGRLGHIPHAKEVPLFFDCVWVGGYPFDTNLPAAVEGTMGQQLNRFAIKRHDKSRANGVMLDGSAESMELPDMWLLRWHKNYIPAPAIVIPWP
jgi:hypothetical protein